jgi:hypothetical protein
LLGWQCVDSAGKSGQICCACFHWEMSLGAHGSGTARREGICIRLFGVKK